MYLELAQTQNIYFYIATFLRTYPVLWLTSQCANVLIYFSIAFYNCSSFFLFLWQINENAKVSFPLFLFFFFFALLLIFSWECSGMTLCKLCQGGFLFQTTPHTATITLIITFNESMSTRMHTIFLVHNIAKDIPMGWVGTARMQ